MAREKRSLRWACRDARLINDRSNSMARVQLFAQSHEPKRVRDRSYCRGHLCVFNGGTIHAAQCARDSARAKRRREQRRVDAAAWSWIETNSGNRSRIANELRIKLCNGRVVPVRDVSIENACNRRKIENYAGAASPQAR